MKKLLSTLSLIALALTGCSSSSTNNANTTSSGSSGGAAPKFTLAWSEYPSWSVFGVAHSQGLLDGAEGKQGELEKKWNVDVVLNYAEYDGCITQYVNSATDAVCITNMDILAPSVGRPAVAIMPTSTSAGADACIAVGINDLAGLKGQTTYGLEKSVSQYCFERVLELNGQNPADFPFVTQDPGVAATGMQNGQAEFKSIMVWNPFVMQTLRKRTDAKVLFDSTKIPEEIIDMVVVGKDSLDKPGGKRFAFCVAEAFYRVSQSIEDSNTRDAALKTLGEKFGSSSLEDMKVIVEQTKFYKTPETALALFAGEKFAKETMPHVAQFCVSHGISDKAPTFSFVPDNVQLVFSSEILTGLQNKVEPESVK